MDFVKSELKNIIIFVAILGGLYLSYTYFFKDSSESVSEIPLEGSGGEVGASILPILLQLQTIKLDQSVFGDPIFKSLENFGVELPREDAGRPNPFAPTGKVQAPQGSVNVRTSSTR